MNNLVFVSGFQNSGTRLVVDQLERFGYEVPDTKIHTKDWLSYDLKQWFFELWVTGKHEEWWALIDGHVSQYESRTVVLKHGYFLPMLRELRARYPKAAQITCWRHPCDYYVKFRKRPRLHMNYMYLDDVQTGKAIRDKNIFRVYHNWYASGFNQWDLLIHLQDIVNHPEEIAKQLAKTVRYKGEIDPIQTNPKLSSVNLWQNEDSTSSAWRVGCKFADLIARKAKRYYPITDAPMV